MNENEIYANDDTQTGGFWSDLAGILGQAVGTTAGTAITQGQRNADLWLRNNIPTTNPPPAAPAAKPNYTPILALAAVALVSFLIWKRRAAA